MLHGTFMTEMLDTVHHLRLKNPQCFGIWNCPQLQVQQEGQEPALVGPLVTAISGPWTKTVQNNISFFPLPTKDMANPTTEKLWVF